MPKQQIASTFLFGFGTVPETYTLCMHTLCAPSPTHSLCAYPRFLPALALVHE